MVLTAALFFLLSPAWSPCFPNDIPGPVRESAAKDGRWGADPTVKKDTRDRVVTHTLCYHGGIYPYV